MSVVFLVATGRVESVIFTLVVCVMVGYFMSFLGDYLLPEPV